MILVSKCQVWPLYEVKSDKGQLVLISGPMKSYPLYGGRYDAGCALHPSSTKYMWFLVPKQRSE